MSQSQLGAALNQPSTSNRTGISPELLALLKQFNQSFFEQMQKFVKTLRNQSTKYQLDITIGRFDGRNWSSFKKDVERYLFAMGKRRYLDEDILRCQVPASEAELQEDMQVQCFIGCKCTESIKRDAERHSKSAFQMWKYLESQYSAADQEINEAIDEICDVRLSCRKDLEEHFRRMNEAFNVLETNKMPVNDNLKSQILFRSLGEVGKRIARRTFDYNQTLVYVRDHFSANPCQQREIACSSNHNCTSHTKSKPRDQPNKHHVRAGHPYLSAGHRVHHGSSNVS